MDPGSGLISGTLASLAASSTPYTVTVRASDGVLSTTQTFLWTVNYVGITNPGDQSNVSGDMVSLPILATGQTGAVLHYSAPVLPPNLSINPNTGVISGTLTPTADSGSPYHVTVTVTDGTHPVSTTFTWTIAHLAVTNPGDRADLEGATVNLPISVQHADGGPLMFTASNLPPGLTINSTTGVIAGTLGSTAHLNSP
jgi:hypothetical protein